MTIYRLKKGWTCGLLVLLCVLLAAGAMAAGRVDTERSCSLTAEFSHEGMPFADVQLRIYRVAKFAASGELSLTEEFSEMSVDFVELDQAAWRKLAQTLSAYVISDGIEPTATAKTDVNGKAVFEGLKPGVYLVVGDSCLTETHYFIPAPAMVAIPATDADDKWDYEQAIKLKYESGERNLVDLTVVKVWQDKGWKPLRPEYITVHLYGNGEKVDEIKLNKYNNWRHEWKNLDGAVDWKVVEKPVPPDYTVEIEQEGEVITVINQRPPAEEDEILPQTGLDWWPVWILAAAGMVLFFLGWLRNRKG